MAPTYTKTRTSSGRVRFKAEQQIEGYHSERLSVLHILGGSVDTRPLNLVSLDQQGPNPSGGARAIDVKSLQWLSPRGSAEHNEIKFCPVEGIAMPVRSSNVVGFVNLVTSQISKSLELHNFDNVVTRFSYLWSLLMPSRHP